VIPCEFGDIVIDAGSVTAPLVATVPLADPDT
jgi:hypothetical protein